MLEVDLSQEWFLHPDQSVELFDDDGDGYVVTTDVITDPAGRAYVMATHEWLPRDIAICVEIRDDRDMT